MDRLNLVLNTQFGLATGYRQKVAALDPDTIDQFPAWRLIRWEDRKLERNWAERWAKAAEGTLEEGRNDDEFMALKNHPIWDNIGSSALFDGSEYVPPMFPLFSAMVPTVSS